jgi:hypothetical protein
MTVREEPQRNANGAYLCATSSLMWFLQDGASQSPQPLHEHRGQLSPSGA